MHKTDRRTFLKQTAGAAGFWVAGSALAQSARPVSANEKLVVGLMGLGIRGPMVAEDMARAGTVEFAYACDCDSNRYERAAKMIVDAAANAEVHAVFRP